MGCIYAIIVYFSVSSMLPFLRAGDHLVVVERCLVFLLDEIVYFYVSLAPWLPLTLDPFRSIELRIICV
jgi:hypothetical protein